MQQIVYFLSKNSTKLLFLLLLIVSFILVVQSHIYHRSQLLSSSNYFAGIIYEKRNDILSYLQLKTENEKLAKENAMLKKLVYNHQIVVDSTFAVNPRLAIANDFEVLQTKIIKNSYSKKDNYLTIKGGTNSGIKKDMGVLNSKGVIGIVEHVSKNYATVLSILNTKSRITAKVQNSEHFGTIVWDTRNTGYVQLTDIPKLAPLKKGDSIVTGGESIIFPENIPIGTIDKVYTTESSNFYTINVQLFNDMTNLGSVYLLENIHKEEIQQLEQYSKQ